MKSNNQETGPQVIFDNDEEGVRRHIIECKVYPATLDDINLLYGQYRNYVVNGDESFISEPAHKMMEGLPVGEDIGGGLFIENGQNLELIGIFSGTSVMLHHQSKYNEATTRILQKIVQPIFPKWIDIRPHWEWIQSHMGPTKLSIKEQNLDILRSTAVFRHIEQCYYSGFNG